MTGGPQKLSFKAGVRLAVTKVGRQAVAPSELKRQKLKTASE
jgi:hypothetical protein